MTQHHTCQAQIDTADDEELGVPYAVQPMPSRYVALDALSLIGPVVYAMRVPGGVIKIGYTTQLNERRGQHRGEVLAVQFGTRAHEAAIHARLVDNRHHGHEWYYPTPAVLAVVNEMRETLGLDALVA